MKNIQKIISALLLAGVITGCSAGGSQTTTASGGETTAAVTASGDTGASTTAIETMAIDRDIILAEGKGIKITSGDVEVEFERMLNVYRKQYGDEMVNGALSMLQEQKSSILEQLIRNAVFTLKAEELGLPLESEKALAEYDKIVADNTASYGSKEAFEQAVADIGYTMDSYRAEILKSYRYQAVAEEMTKDVKLTEDEVKAAYDEQKEANFTQKPGATMYHIFFGQPDDTEAEAKAKEAKAKLDKGAKFSDIAKEYGQDGTASSGGLLGTYTYDTTELGSDFVAEAKKLKEGEISDPVKTSFGWHIIMVENVLTNSKTYGLEDKFPTSDGSEQKVYDIVEQGLLTERKNAKLGSLMEEWKAQYELKSYPEKIPMNVKTEDPASTAPTDTTPAQTNASDTAGSTTTP